VRRLVFKSAFPTTFAFVVAWLLAFAGWAQPAQSHLVGYNEPGVTHDLYTSSQATQCVYWNGNCAVHSWGYISVKDLAEVQWHCAEKHKTSYPASGSLDERKCEFEQAVARLCTTHQAHAGGSGATHCVDQDVNNWKVAGHNEANFGSTLRRHALY
jgi:hypothetical protein